MRVWVSSTFIFIHKSGGRILWWVVEGLTDRTSRAGRNIKADICSTAMHRSPQIEGRLR